MQSDFKVMDGSYYQTGDYLLPNVGVPDSPQIGIWGEQRRRYLQKNQKSLYTAMLLGGTLNAHLEDVDRSAKETFERLTEQMKLRDGVTEALKAVDQMEWVQRMNAIRHEATATVMKELICV